MSLQVGDDAWATEPDNHFSLVTITADNGDAFLAVPREHGGGGTAAAAKAIKKSLLVATNPKFMDGVEDMIDLSHLHEAALLHNVEFRYAWDLIYTYVGQLLLAVNPYKALGVYAEDVVQAYAANQARAPDGSRLAPHLFTLADNAFRSLLRDHRNQSIIISGESGSGKTESTKYVMTYLATIGGRDGVGELESKILDTNPIMEAFGNAKTTRNDNSSRFGKFIQLRFSSDGLVAGAGIRSYLLEKSRLVFQSKGERNYHIFYQLCCGAREDLKQQLHLKAPQEFRFLNQSDCFVAANAYASPDITDADAFTHTANSMRMVGIEDAEFSSIIQLVAALLHVGNITFKKQGSKDAAEILDAEAHAVSAKLLGVSQSDLATALVKKNIQSAMETIAVERNVEEANLSRDALAKAAYRLLFDWLIRKINICLAFQTAEDQRFIGILDIFGFEFFPQNSFEQLCINYANEKLQKFFNDHVLAKEQEEYVAEGIDWSQVKWVDNQPCLDLIEKKPSGVLTLLDEECMLGNAATDESACLKIKQNNEKHPNFVASRFGNKSFSVKHYAGCVEYLIDGFLDKNNDALHADLTNLMKGSSVEFFNSLFKKGLQSQDDTNAGAAAGATPGAAKKPGPAARGKKVAFVSVGSQFRAQLQELMGTLSDTNPYFIRCIKPNPQKVRGIFNRASVLEQLRCGGVVEAVRVCQAGFPTRYPYELLWNGMGLKVLVPHAQRHSISPRDGLKIVMAKLDSRSIQFGKTKLFFRVGVLAKIEDERRAFVQSKASKLQGVIRGHASRGRAALRRAYIRILAACRVVQAQWQYSRTLAAIQVQAVSKRTLSRSRHGQLLLVGRLLASAIATSSKRNAFIFECVRLRAGVKASSACRQSVARHALAQSIFASVISQSVLRQCLSRTLYIQRCAAYTLMRFCVTQRLTALKREALLKNAAAVKILFARRRAQFYRRWYNRLVGRSVRVMQYACVRAVAQHKVTFRIASSSLARFVIARVARSRYSRLPPAVSLLSLSLARKFSVTNYSIIRTQTRASTLLKAFAARASPRLNWVKLVISARMLGEQLKAVVPRKSLRNSVVATRLQAVTRCCLLSRTHSRVLGQRAAAAAAVRARAKRAVANRKFVSDFKTLVEMDKKESERAAAEAERTKIVSAAAAARAFNRALELQRASASVLPDDCGEYSDFASVPVPLQGSVSEMQALVIPGLYFEGSRLDPSSPCLRRTYARWIVSVNNFHNTDVDLYVRLADPSTSEAAFTDVPPDDPDFDVIQGLAEAGLIESTLLDPSGPTSFNPNGFLTRETLVIMKASIDARGEIPAKTVADVQRMWRFKDAAAMPQLLIDSLAYDYDLAERSVVSRSLPRGLLFLKDKQVSNVEALVSCWFIGIGRGRNGPSCGIDSKDRAPKRERDVRREEEERRLKEEQEKMLKEEEEKRRKEEEKRAAEAAATQAAAEALAADALRRQSLEAAARRIQPPSSVSSPSDPPSARTGRSPSPLLREAASITMNPTVVAARRPSVSADAESLPPAPKKEDGTGAGAGGGFFKKFGTMSAQGISRGFSSVKSIFGGSGGKDAPAPVTPIPTAPILSPGGGRRPSQDTGHQHRRPSVVIGSFMMPLEEQHTRYHQLLERALAEDLTDINRFKVMTSAGHDREGRPVLWITGRHVPADRGPELLERLFYLFISHVDRLSHRPYVVCLLGTEVKDSNILSTSWMDKVAKEFPRRFKDNLHKIFSSSNSKVTHVTRREELQKYFEPSEIAFPT